MEKMTWDGPKWGQEDFFPTNPDLADILGRMDLNFDNLHFSNFLDPKFLDFQVPRFPNSQKSGLSQAWPELGRAWVREHRPPAAPRQPQRTNLRRSKELGQDRENPISASPVWGTIPKIWDSKNPVNKKQNQNLCRPKCRQGVD